MENMQIFDGHIDTFTKLFLSKDSQNKSFLVENDFVHVDLIKAKKGGLAGSFCAIMVPQPEDSPERDPYYGLTITDTGYDVTYRSQIDCDYAVDFTDSVIAFIEDQVFKSGENAKIIKTYDDFRQSMHEGRFGIVLHLEGAAAIKEDLSNLEQYYEKGVRSIGLAWSRPNVFAHGVPYKFPHSPDIGPGLSSAGKKLVKACNKLGIIIDLAHLNGKGFWDVACLSNKPLVVSHAGVHALCPSTRNLTNDQIVAVGKSGGVIGVLFESTNLRKNGMPDEKMPISRIVEHVDYIAKRIGIDHVAFGSDFDGADMPYDLSNALFLSYLIKELKRVGYSDTEVEKIAFHNWMRVMSDTWKS